MIRATLWVLAILFASLLVFAPGCGDDEIGDGEEAVCTGSGVWDDPTSGLCWEEPTGSGDLLWQDAVTYCEDLDVGGYDNWRVPKIQELISLIRGCGSAECGVHDPDCLGDTCVDGSDCDTCDYSGGDGQNGCYWDPALTPTSDTGSDDCIHWSISPYGSDPENRAWYAVFDYAGVHGGDGYKDQEVPTRCVRGTL